LCFGYKNPEKKFKIPFRIKKSRTENNTFGKIYLEEIIVFWKRGPECNFICTSFF